MASSSSVVGVAVGVAIAAVVLVLLFVAVIIFLLRRRRRRRRYSPVKDVSVCVTEGVNANRIGSIQGGPKNRTVFRSL